jgi:hypothetical protein
VVRKWMHFMLVSNEASILVIIAAFDWVSSVVDREFDAKTALQES